MSAHWDRTKLFKSGHLSPEKMHRKALELGRKLRPAVKISSDNDFTKHVSEPYDEHLHRREDRCNLTTYSIRSDWCYFRVFITNTSRHPVELFPVRIDARGNKRPLASFTVQPQQEGDVPVTLEKHSNPDEDGMQILDANGNILLELRFRGVPARDEFRKAVEHQDAFSDESYYSAEEGPLTPRPVSALAIVPHRNTYWADTRRKNAYKPELHGTGAQLERMCRLLD